MRPNAEWAIYLEAKRGKAVKLQANFECLSSNCQPNCLDCQSTLLSVVLNGEGEGGIRASENPFSFLIPVTQAKSPRILFN